MSIPVMIMTHRCQISHPPILVTQVLHTTAYLQMLTFASFDESSLVWEGKPLNSVITLIVNRWVLRLMSGCVTHRGRRRPAGGGHSPEGSRWGTEAAGRSWKTSARSRPDWSGKWPARRSTDAGTWDKKEARLETQRHGRNSRGVRSTHRWG